MDDELKKDVGIAAAGAGVAGIAGAWFGSGVGIASGGAAIAATGPFAIAGAAIVGPIIYIARREIKRRGETEGQDEGQP